MPTSLREIFPVTGNFTGKSAISGHDLEIVIVKMAAPQRYLSEFLTRLNRENILRIREFRGVDQGIIVRIAPRHVRLAAERRRSCRARDLRAQELVER
jgi:hypothetical protein